MRHKQFFICVDFDGTITDHAYPEVGELLPNAVMWMKRWQDAGAKLILLTMRHGESLSAAAELLTENELYFYGYNENPAQVTDGSRKVFGHLYIDDIAFGAPLKHYPGMNRPCINWDVVGPGVLEMLDIC